MQTAQSFGGGFHVGFTMYHTSRVWIGPIVKLDPEYIGVYILYESRVISVSVIMVAIMNLQLPVRSGSVGSVGSVGSSYIEFGMSKTWL